MPEPVKTVQNQPDPSAQISATQRPEGPPINVSASREATTQEVSQYLEPSGELATPNTSGVDNFVKVNRDFPEIKSDAKDAGVSESVITGPNYVPPAFENVQNAEKVAKSTKPSLSLAWIATEAAKNLKRMFSKQSLEQKPAH